MAKRRGAGGTPATVALTEAGVGYALHPYTHDPRATSYGEEAARELGLDPARVFKTLVVSVGAALAVAVVPVSEQLDLKALARVLGASRAVLAEVAAAERSTGYLTGGISPLGQKRPLPTVVDETAAGFPTVYVSAGRRGLDVELAPADLVRLTGARTARIGSPRGHGGRVSRW